MKSWKNFILKSDETVPEFRYVVTESIFQLKCRDQCMKIFLSAHSMFSSTVGHISRKSAEDCECFLMQKFGTRVVLFIAEYCQEANRPQFLQLLMFFLLSKVVFDKASILARSSTVLCFAKSLQN